jgi:hypothetical protein
VSDSTASLRQRLKAASIILGYRVQDADVTAFTKRFLESTCANVDVPIDYRIEAGECLRRSEDTMIRPPVERAPARAEETKEREVIVPLADLLRRRRARQDALEDLPIDDPRRLAWVDRDEFDAPPGNGSDNTAG